MERQRIRFASGDTQCTAWHYPGVNGGTVAPASGPGAGAKAAGRLA
jgi:uncharacterized protein